MGYVKWSYDTLNQFCTDVFKAFGFNDEESAEIKDVLLTADLYGIESHGMQRMVRDVYTRQELTGEFMQEDATQEKLLQSATR